MPVAPSCEHPVASPTLMLAIGFGLPLYKTLPCSVARSLWPLFPGSLAEPHVGFFFGPKYQDSRLHELFAHAPPRFRLRVVMPTTRSVLDAPSLSRLVHIDVRTGIVVAVSPASSGMLDVSSPRLSLQLLTPTALPVIVCSVVAPVVGATCHPGLSVRVSSPI